MKITKDNVPDWPEEFSRRERIILHNLIQSSLSITLNAQEILKYRRVGNGFIEKLRARGFMPIEAIDDKATRFLFKIQEAISEFKEGTAHTTHEAMGRAFDAFDGEKTE
jgi:hypothetical protein